MIKSAGGNPGNTAAQSPFTSSIPGNRFSVIPTPLTYHANATKRNGLHRSCPIRRIVAISNRRRVVNWLRVVRDYPEDFGSLVEKTPISRVEYQWALTAMDDESLLPLRRALAFHVVVEQAVVHIDKTSRERGRKITPAVGSVARIRAANIAAIAERLRDAQLECQDACSLPERVKGCDYAVIYADPPYWTADISAYPVSDLELDRCAGLLAAQRGAVGISGYANEWDLLGWRRVTRPALRRQISGGG